MTSTPVAFDLIDLCQVGGAAVVTVVLLALWRRRRCRFVLYWAVSWAFLCAACALARLPPDQAVRLATWTTAPLAGLGQVAFLLIGTHAAATGRHPPPRWLFSLLGALALMGAAGRVSWAAAGAFLVTAALAGQSAARGGGLGPQLMAVASLTQSLAPLRAFARADPPWTAVLFTSAGFVSYSALGLAMVIWLFEDDRAQREAAFRELDLERRLRADGALLERECALHDSIERYRLLFEGNPAPMWVYDVETLALLDANEAALRQYGYPRGEFLALTVHDLMASDAAEFVTAPAVSSPASAWIHRRRDGTRLEVEVAGHSLSLGGRRARCVLVTDIGARRSAQAEQARLGEAIERNAQEWQMTFDAIESAVVILDVEARVVRLNRAARELTGRPFSELLGRRTQDLAPGEPWTTGAAVVGQVLPTGMPAEAQAHGGPGQASWDVSATVVPGGAGKDGRVILVARDVSRVVELQESLRRGETMAAMGSLVAGVAHEVRNPLFGISSTLDAFEARFGRSEDVQRYLRVLRPELDRLSSLMSDLLEFGKPRVLELEEASIEGLLAQAIFLCETTAKQAKVNLRNAVGWGLAPVPMDRRRLLLLFRNLIENAIQHSPAGGGVTVAAREDGEGALRFLECSVRDTGSGFRSEDLPKLFEPFFTRRRGGTGLGLSIARRIVEEHGGAISALSHPEGGALVTVRLPYARTTAPAIGPAAPRPWP